MFTSMTAATGAALAAGGAAATSTATAASLAGTLGAAAASASTVISSSMLALGAEAAALSGAMGAATAAGSTLSSVMTGMSALSGLMGVYGSIQSAKQQKEQGRYQSEVARQNAELAEENASAQRRQGYEAMVDQRRKAAHLIGQQRAVAGASGVAVDVGSNLDIQADTAAQGEMDALKMYQQGLDKAYSYDIQGANYASQSKAYAYSANQARSTGLMNAASSAISGIADMGSTWLKYSTLKSDRKPIHNNLRLAGGY